MNFFKFFENPLYELRWTLYELGVHLPSRNSRTIFFSTESIMNLGPKLWNVVPQNINPLHFSMFTNLKPNAGRQIIVRIEFADFAEFALANLVL